MLLHHPAHRVAPSRASYFMPSLFWRVRKGATGRFWREAAIRNFGEQLLEHRMNNEFASAIAAVSLTAVRSVEIARSVPERVHNACGPIHSVRKVGS